MHGTGNKIVITMINFINLDKGQPYKLFHKKYKDALKESQKSIEAISICSFDSIQHEVNSRYVNLKIVNGKDFIFFSNYNSPKAKQFLSHNQVSILIYWNNINTQIRMKANIKKTTNEFNQQYFKKRDKNKNALAISSKQSEVIESYKAVQEKFNITYKNMDLSECPHYWGGFIFTPYYFEFWEGHESRINKRRVFEKINLDWKQHILQP